MRIYSIAMKDETHLVLFNHLSKQYGQEDLCFATYVPSTGANRASAILSQVILPEDGDRSLHGNVSFMPKYLERALRIAAKKKEGLAFLHSHLTNGWQGMSNDDIAAELRIAPATMAITNLPLIGLTMGYDGAWSGRYWIKNQDKKRSYQRCWCDTVRVLGKKLTITYNDAVNIPAVNSARQFRTISAWGTKTQDNLSRLKVGIVGLGSVGSMVAEILARTGISDFTLIDFDIVEEKNLDRLVNVFMKDVGQAKVSVISEAIKNSATSPDIKIDSVLYSICEKQGFEKALNCDVLFSCVDRPWPRQVLNFVSYAHLIPVVDGGILVRTNKSNTAIVGADWKVQTVGYKRACLECLGQYKTENAVLEIEGKLDDPEYIRGLDKSLFLDAHENVFVFSSHLASMEVLQMLSLCIAPSGIADIGQQMQHFVPGIMDTTQDISCNENCFFQTIVGRGDNSGVTIYAQHPVAMNARTKKLKENFHTSIQKRVNWYQKLNLFIFRLWKGANYFRI